MTCIGGDFAREGRSMSWCFQYFQRVSTRSNRKYTDFMLEVLPKRLMLEDGRRPNCNP